MSQYVYMLERTINLPDVPWKNHTGTSAHDMSSSDSAYILCNGFTYGMTHNLLQ